MLVAIGLDMVGGRMPPKVKNVLSDATRIASARPSDGLVLARFDEPSSSFATA
jgi:hypothetical protein